MNNKIFIKIAWMFILGLLAYLLFVVFYLSPKVNSYLSETEVQNARSQYNKLVTIINNKSRTLKEDYLEKFTDNMRILLSSVTLGKSGFIYVFNSQGQVIIDPSGEFESQDLSKLILPSTNNKLLIDEIKNAHASRQAFEYNWNKVYDPYNYSYKKISWVEYNKKLDWYIVSSIYKEDFKSFVDGTNGLILNISMLLFGILSVIALFIGIKVIVPLNRMFQNVQKVNPTSINNIDSSIKSKDEIGFLASQFNSLLDQVEANKHNIDEQVESKTKEIENKLYYDQLTNLKNRTALKDEIKENDFVSIALIDIDAFDDINELYGFSTGNLVLIETAKMLSEFANKHSVAVHRIYGNVFALVDKKMMGFSRYNEFIEDLSKLFKNNPVLLKDLDLEISINITLGISIAQDEPLKTAGIALKKAKKNNMPYFVYNNEIDTKEIIKKSMYWREKIKLALQNDKVLPFYQPILNRQKEIVKYETLMRIEDIDENGQTVYLSPYFFFDVAIKTKQYLSLSNVVISKAFADLQKTEKMITLNLSFKDIMDSDFNESLNKHLDKVDSDAKERIVFEILESDYITDYRILEEFIKTYRSQGIKIAIDDFGTGYSNFAHILKIRPDYIKIDGSLIKNINEDKNSYEMVKSIIDFTKALNIRVVAEFIHNEEVFNTVMELGVDEFQGFYLGEPSPNLE
ncbi:sensor domain-containing phosphodiesterase [Malaciobacter pacificus]|uniref:Cache sensor-containing diguanylate cyclase/phosphodiesterase n=1 Tax=Malaciobacter pacificus TaxID=1080223 RepID=A0A5C2HB76_9BACT|nr:sensor domain-containing phosphodiesterase [Malaciobacter pacificus]QEP35478.1 Cache sensor-containing diguanylate cyclase/phosphodiesterase [Malaciobacter pacificus]